MAEIERHRGQSQRQRADEERARRPVNPIERQTQEEALRGCVTPEAPARSAIFADRFIYPVFMQHP